MEFWVYIGYFACLLVGLVLGASIMLLLIVQKERNDKEVKRGKAKPKKEEDNFISETDKTVVLKNSISLKDRLQPKKSSLAETQCEIEGRDLAETLKETRKKEENTFKGLKKEIEKKRYKLN